MENKDKNTALFDFIDMIYKSWTFERLTIDERKKAIDALPNNNELRGNYYQRFEVLHAVYYAFLLGAGYNPTNWRETKSDD